MLAVNHCDEAYIDRCRARLDAWSLNEVRVPCSSLLNGDGVLIADKTIKLDPATTILGLAPGDPFALGEDDFVRLCSAYFDRLEVTFGWADRRARWRRGPRGSATGSRRRRRRARPAGPRRTPRVPPGRSRSRPATARSRPAWAGAELAATRARLRP